MDQLPHIKEFKAPEGYFDRLPDHILAKTQKSPLSAYWKYAAAAAVLLSLGIWQFGELNVAPSSASIDEQALLYIESNQWTAEDVLSMSEDPNALLDQIIQEEMASYTPAWSDESEWY